MPNSNNGASQSSPAVERILYKEITEDDRKKAIAASNTKMIGSKKTGGGARDFRYGSYKLLTPVIEKMFPVIRNVPGTKKGQPVVNSYREGTLFWK